MSKVMTDALVVEGYGGPDAMQLRSVEVPPPAAGEIQVRQTALGVNFIDVYYRTGHYKAPALPFIPGMEGAGTVDALGSDVEGFHVGDRVAYLGVLGGYAGVRNLPASRAVRLPAEVSDEVAAGMMLKGLTAQYLLRQTLPLAAGDDILFHAGAGGVGLIACQWARHLGLRLIATAGGPEKCALAKAAGASEVLDYTREDFRARVRELTGGAGVKAVFDSVGKDTFAASLDCLRPFGMMVSFGQSSGPVPPVDVITLSTKGSLYLTRPTIVTHVARRERYEAMAQELFDLVAAGVVRVDIRQKYALRDGAQAHRDLEGRKTSGVSILVP
jgi:NADPH:quinone reductase